MKNTGHIDAGMHGMYFLLKFLMEEDRNDLIYDMASKTDYPSWGYMLEQGATTIWENWSGGSHIHDTLISIGSWFIQGIGGIRIDEKSPGFRHFLIKPAVVGDLTFARTRYRSPYGPIVSNWRMENGMSAPGRDRAARDDGHGLCSRFLACGGDRRRPPGGAGRGGTLLRHGERQGAVRGGFGTVRLRDEVFALTGWAGGSACPTRETCRDLSSSGR